MSVEDARYEVEHAIAKIIGPTEIGQDGFYQMMGAQMALDEYAVAVRAEERAASQLRWCEGFSAGVEKALEQAEEREARLREALRLSDAWPVTSVLTTLADAARHVQDKHGCDHHGYETVREAAVFAREIVRALEGA